MAYALLTTLTQQFLKLFCCLFPSANLRARSEVRSQQSRWMHPSSQSGRAPSSLFLFNGYSLHYTDFHSPFWSLLGVADRADTLGVPFLVPASAAGTAGDASAPKALDWARPATPRMESKCASSACSSLGVAALGAAGAYAATGSLSRPPGETSANGRLTTLRFDAGRRCVRPQRRRRKAATEAGREKYVIKRRFRPPVMETGPSSGGN